MNNIILTTLNARYIHSSLGLRYLHANMAELQQQTRLIEFNISTRAIDIAESLLAQNAAIIGFGVYIWNIHQTTEVIQLIKRISPETTIVIGGPEVSFEYEQELIFTEADYLISGQADTAFSSLCREILLQRNPMQKVINPAPVNLSEIKLPYEYYTDEDIAHRIIYVEASRGCPFKCEFCLSALDKKVFPIELERFLNAMQTLYDRGARHFKFVDRTFNLKLSTSLEIMSFFKDKLNDELFLHFELIPDHLPEQLKTVITQFPENCLQFEIGIQSLDPKVQKRISRRQDNIKTAENIRWLTQHSNAHIHADLIIGLPGEDITLFAKGFDQLANLNAHEIQVGILKRLKGTPVIRHTDDWDMRYNPNPPYNILSTSVIDFMTMQRLTRFSRYWDLIANSGRFTHTLELILAEHPFDNFMLLSDWLYKKTDQTHRIALEKLFSFLHQAIIDVLKCDKKQSEECLLLDFQRSGIKGRPRFMMQSQPKDTNKKQSHQKRQQQHSVNKPIEG